MPKIAVIWNPSKIERDRLAAALTAAGAAETLWFETTEDDPGQGPARAALAEHPDVIAVAGGDGTVRAVAEVLAETDAAPELAILPQGTGNLLARNLGIPLDLDEAAHRAVTGTAKPLDFGWVETIGESGTERHGFAVIVGFGVDANMIAETDDDAKARIGWLAYAGSIGKAIAGTDVLDTGIRATDADGNVEAHDLEAHTVLVGNCGTVQGGLTLLPDAEPDDGLLDAVVLHADGFAGWLGTVRSLVWENGIKRLISDDGMAESTDETTHVQAVRIHVSLPHPRPFQVDGELVGRVSEFDTTIQPAALRVR